MKALKMCQPSIMQPQMKCSCHAVKSDFVWLRQKWSLGRSGPIGPWAVRARLDPGPFGPNWTLGRSGPIGPWAIRAHGLGMSLLWVP